MAINIRRSIQENSLKHVKSFPFMETAIALVVVMAIMEGLVGSSVGRLL